MNTEKRHRLPPDSISYAVWRYYRFNLSHYDIEGLLAERGITVSREAILLFRRSGFWLHMQRLTIYLIRAGAWFGLNTIEISGSVCSNDGVGWLFERRHQVYEATRS